MNLETRQHAGKVSAAQQDGGQVLPEGTDYITDVGLTDPYDGVIGVKKELVVNKFLNGMPVRFEPATGDVRLCAVVIDCDEKTGKARDIERLMLS